MLVVILTVALGVLAHCYIKQLREAINSNAKLNTLQKEMRAQQRHIPINSENYDRAVDDDTIKAEVEGQWVGSRLYFTSESAANRIDAMVQMRPRPDEYLN